MLGNTEIGRYLFGLVASPALKRGVTLAVFHRVGNSLLSILKLKINSKIGSNSILPDFNMYNVIPSQLDEGDEDRLSMEEAIFVWVV